MEHVNSPGGYCLLENHTHPRLLNLDEPERQTTCTISAPRIKREKAKGVRVCTRNTCDWSDYYSLHSEQLSPSEFLSHGLLGTATPQMFPFLWPKPTHQIKTSGQETPHSFYPSPPRSTMFPQYLHSSHSYREETKEDRTRNVLRMELPSVSLRSRVWKQRDLHICS